MYSNSKAPRRRLILGSNATKKENKGECARLLDEMKKGGCEKCDVGGRRSQIQVGVEERYVYLQSVTRKD